MIPSAILVVEDDPLQRRLIKENLEGEGYFVLEASSVRESVDLVSRYPVDVAVVDHRLGRESGLDVIAEVLRLNPLLTPIMVTAFADVETAVEAMRRGAYDYIVKPIDFEKFKLVLERALERQRLRSEVTELRASLEERFSFKEMVIASPAMEEVGRLLGRAAQSEATVLITGETGTGKDLVARAVHFSSKRSGRPFLAVNIPSLPETLVEAELFGAEKGAFTGASERRTGKFEAAAGGTLLLDEVGDLPPQVQVKLLRFLQDREYFRLGSSKPLKADVRVLAATNRDLEALMAEGRFRQDLYYRLNVIRIAVPPLRERREEIPVLADFFIRKYGRREGKAVEGITSEAMDLLRRYDYPGNVRELENIIERAVVFSDGRTVSAADLPVFTRARTEAEDAPLEEKVRRLETREIRRALLESGGVKSKAARRLGLTERVLSYKVKQLKIEKDS